MLGRERGLGPQRLWVWGEALGRGTGQGRDSCLHWLGGPRQVHPLPGPRRASPGAFQLLSPELERDRGVLRKQMPSSVGPSCQGVRGAGTPARSATTGQSTRAAPLLRAARPGPERLAGTMSWALRRGPLSQPHGQRQEPHGHTHASPWRPGCWAGSGHREPPWPGCPSPTGPSALRGTQWES